MAELEPTTDPTPEAPPTPLTRAERIFIRFTFWQTVLSLAGIVIALAALYAALSQTSELRRQTAAAVWPFLEMSVADHDSAERAEFALVFTNKGVGPARLLGLRIAVAGTPVHDMPTLVDRLGGAPEASLRRNFLARRVFRPQESIELLATSDPAVARRFQAALAAPGNAITYCYCSIFDQCWLADSRSNLHAHAVVAQCPEFGPDAFRD